MAELLELALLPDELVEKFRECATSNESEDVEIEPIGEGGRNVYLTGVAAALRRKGAGFNEINISIQAMNLARCSPPLPEPEVEGIARSFSTRSAADPNAPKYTKALPELALTEDQKKQLQPTAQIPTDFDMAVDFETVYGDQFLYDHKRKTWFDWLSEESRWNGNGAYSRAMQAKFRLSRAMRTLVDMAPLTDAQKRDWYQVLRRAENGRIPEIQLERAAILPRFSEDAGNFDADPHIANAGNAWIDTSKDAMLSGDFLREPDRANRVTKKLGALYDPEATAPRWERFISEVFQGDEELIAYVQRAAGSSLDGFKLFQAFFVAYGHGRNGKSTFLNTIAKVMGDYAQSTAFDTFDVETKSSTGNDLAALQGARLVLAIEAEQTRQLAEARIKAITGGDMVVCRFLYGEFFQYLPQYSVWLAVNYKPVVKGTDHGIWRRIQLIPFQAKFEGTADDKELPQKLAQERSGILNWLLVGLKDYYLQGLNPPKAVLDATKEYRAEQDTIGQWLLEEATFGEEHIIGATEAYEAYVEWEKNDRKNLEPFKMKTFSGILEGKEVETDDGRAITIRKDTWRSGPKKNRVYFEGFTLRHRLPG